MRGIDISKYQENVDYSKLKSQGIEFVIIRCGYGKVVSQKDPLFEKHYNGCKEAGLKVGAYLYSYCSNINDAYLEAKNCLEFIKGKEFDLPIFYDLEEERTSKLGREAVTLIADRFCETIRQAGYVPGVYANLHWFKNNIVVNDLISKNIEIWLAQWTTNPTKDFKYNFWQYTSNGFIDGITGTVDMNLSTYETNEKPDEVKKSNEEIAQEVIKGLWGNGDDRKNKLVNAVYDYNAIQDIVNKKLKPSQTVYIVKKGDNLTKIARAYGTTINKLKDVNNIKDVNKIYVGQKLIIK